MICKEADREQARIYKTYVATHPKKKKPTKAEREELAQEVGLPPVRTEVEELAALGPPRGDEKKVAKLINELEKAIRLAEEFPGTVERTFGNPFSIPAELARNYGFKACAEAL